DAGEAGNARGRRPARRAAVAELAVGVVAPRPHRAVARARERVLEARGHLHDAGETYHARRCGNAGELLADGARAELPVVVLAPRPQSSVASHDERLRGVRGDRHGIVDAGDLRRRAASVAVIAELAVEIRAPRPHGSIGLAGDGVDRAGRDLHYIREAWHLHRRRATGR